MRKPFNVDNFHSMVNIAIWTVCDIMTTSSLSIYKDGIIFKYELLCDDDSVDSDSIRSLLTSHIRSSLETFRPLTHVLVTSLDSIMNSIVERLGISISLYRKTGTVEEYLFKWSPKSIYKPYSTRIVEYGTDEQRYQLYQLVENGGWLPIFEFGLCYDKAKREVGLDKFIAVSASNVGQDYTKLYREVLEFIRDIYPNAITLKWSSSEVPLTKEIMGITPVFEGLWGSCPLQVYENVIILNDNLDCIQAQLVSSHWEHINVEKEPIIAVCEKLRAFLGSTENKRRAIIMNNFENGISELFLYEISSILKRLNQEVTCYISATEADLEKLKDYKFECITLLIS